MSIIEELKENEKAFGLMSEEMQAKLYDSPCESTRYYGNSGWRNCLSSIDGLDNYKTMTFRLRDDYEEPEIVEREVFVTPDWACLGPHLVYTDSFGNEQSITGASGNPDFIGFNLEGRIWGRLYKRKDNGDTSICIYADQLDEYDIVDMADAKVIFKKALDK